jgi:DHA1 family multidrug resistance protein-like MFS transporter
MYGVGLMAFVLFLSTLVGVPVLPRLSQELGASGTQIPIVVSAALATVVVVQFFTGILADRYSTRSLILIGASLGSVSSFLCAIATHWTHLVALRVVGGVADAIAMPALLAITARLGTDQPGKFFGILRGSQGLSFVVGPAVGSACSLVSLRLPFLVDGSLSLLAFLAGFRLLSGAQKATTEHTLSVFRGLRSAFSNNRVYLYLLMGIAGTFAFGIFQGFVPTKAHLMNLRAWHIGVILSGGALIFSVVSYITGRLSDRHGPRTFVIVSQVVIVASGLGLFTSESLVGLAGFYWLFCAGETVTYLLSFVYATDIFDKRYVGTSMAAFDSLMDLSLFLGPLVAISSYKVTGNIGPPFLIAVLPAAVAFFTLVICLPRDRRSRLTDDGH